MLNTIIALLLVAVWVAVATFADMRFKEAQSIFSTEFLFGVAGYGVTCFLAIATFRYATFGWIFLVWNSMSLALGLGLATSYYHEPLTTRRLITAGLLAGAMFLAE
ncbi:hypothetical protein [Bradyrhizobium sp.]